MFQHRYFDICIKRSIRINIYACTHCTNIQKYTYAFRWMGYISLSILSLFPTLIILVFLLMPWLLTIVTYPSTVKYMLRIYIYISSFFFSSFFFGVCALFSKVIPERNFYRGHVLSPLNISNVSYFTINISPNRRSQSNNKIESRRKYYIYLYVYNTTRKVKYAPKYLGPLNNRGKKSTAPNKQQRRMKTYFLPTEKKI